MKQKDLEKLRRCLAEMNFLSQGCASATCEFHPDTMKRCGTAEVCKCSWRFRELQNVVESITNPRRSNSSSPLKCRRCGNDIRSGDGLCSDETCVFSCHLQTCINGWYGHPIMGNKEMLPCLCFVSA